MARVARIGYPVGIEGEFPVAATWKTRAKKAFLGLAVALGLLCLAEGILALCGVRPIVQQEDPFVGFASYAPLFVKATRGDGTAIYRTALYKRPLFNVQEFLREKPQGTFRIFCLGGSTTFGSPYDDSVSFCGWLRALLRSAAPQRKYELVNAGGLSYASYRIAALLDELIEYEPDLFILYTGHNEFLEYRSYKGLIQTPGLVLRLASAANHTRIATLLRSGLIRMGLIPKKPAVPKKRAILPEEVDALLDTTVGPSDYVRDEAWAAGVREHFRVSLNRIIDTAVANGIPIVMVTPASNLADCSPFKSDDAGAAEAYERGRKFFADGQYAEAKETFIEARDLDVCPLRATSRLIQIVRDVARARNVPLIDFVAMVDARAEHGIPGRREFLDHVHPTLAGHREIALALLNRLVELGAVSLSPDWDERALERVTRKVNDRVDNAMHGRALRQLSKVLGWGGKFEESRWLALQALEYIPDDVECLFQVGAYSHVLGDHEQAELYLRRALAIDPTYGRAHLWLAKTLRHLGRKDEANVAQKDALRFLKADDLDSAVPRKKDRVGTPKSP